jgi:serine/threonine-protein kinase
VRKIMAAAPESARSKRSDVPEGLDAIILKCLEKDRASRFQNIGELATALAAYAPRRAIASVERIAGVMRSAGLSMTALVHPPISALAGAHAKAATGVVPGQSVASSSGSKTVSVEPPGSEVHRTAITDPPSEAGATGSSSWGRTHFGASRRKVAQLAALGIVAMGALAIVLVARRPSNESESGTPMHPSATAHEAAPGAAPATREHTRPTAEPIEPAREPTGAPPLSSAAGAPKPLSEVADAGAPSHTGAPLEAAAPAPARMQKPPAYRAPAPPPKRKPAPPSSAAPEAPTTPKPSVFDDRK